MNQSTEKPFQIHNITRDPTNKKIWEQEKTLQMMIFALSGGMHVVAIFPISVNIMFIDSSFTVGYLTTTHPVVSIYKWQPLWEIQFWTSSVISI